MANTISVTFPGGKRVNAQIGDHIILTDQSKLSGGDGSAPEPFQLFLASLATCAGIYALQFCQSRGITTDDMSLEMSLEFDPDVKRFTHISLNLNVSPEFPDNLKPAVIRAMDLCTVKKHIMNPPVFHITTS